MNRRGFLGRLAAAAAAIGITPFVSKAIAIPPLELPSELSDDEVLENLDAGVYDGEPFFTSQGGGHIAARCPFVMGRGSCGYCGPRTRCDKSFGSCLSPESFGGFPGAALGAPVYARPDGGATCLPEYPGAPFLGICVGVDKGSTTKAAGVDVACRGSGSFRL